MMKVNDFLNELEQSLRPKIDLILNHRFILALKNQELSLKQIQDFALQYWIYCSYFPRYLAACAASIPDDKTRLPIIDNLWDEHGNGKLENSHRELFKDFCYKIGLTQTDFDKLVPFSSTHIYTEYMLNICQEGGFIKALGALGPGTEYFTSGEYKIIYQSLFERIDIPNDALKFWEIHVSLDEHHYNTMILAVMPWLESASNQELFKEGAMRSIELEKLFWDGLEDNILV